MKSKKWYKDDVHSITGFLKVGLWHFQELKNGDYYLLGSD
jgi:hypothetical protein